MTNSADPDQLADQLYSFYGIKGIDTPWEQVFFLLN